MEANLADSTTVTYSKFPHYFLPYTLSSTPNYSISNGTPIGYTTASVSVPLQLRSTHQPADEPRLCDGGITPSPSNSTSSRDGDINGETHFKPTDFDGISASTCRSLVTLTPSESSRSGSVASDRSSSRESDQSPSVLVVHTPREACPVTVTPENCNDTNGTSNNPRASAPASPTLAHGITVNLLDKELWQTFKSVGNEMIVTKPGRRLFPALLVGIRGLELYTEYTISLRISSADPYRYKFVNMQWVAVGESEVMQNEDRQIFCHHNSPSTGQFWMKKPISFKQVKITHNPSSKFGNILLHTMHKYVMEIVLEPEGQPAITIPIPDTEFMAVTAYQNSKITQLKIDKNPFAKGFRDRANAGYHHPSTLPLPSLFGSPYGHPPLWPQQLPAYHIPQSPLPVQKEGSQTYPMVDSLPVLPTYGSRPAISPPYPYYPPTCWPTVHPQSPDES